MTNEEAIKMLKSKMDEHTDTSYEWVETVRMAIKALEQQPCEDCISREAVKKLKKYCLNYDTNTTIPKTDIFVKIADIEELSSVTPKAQNALEEDPRRCENCLHFVTRDSAGIVLCGSDAWECDFTPKEG